VETRRALSPLALRFATARPPRPMRWFVYFLRLQDGNGLDVVECARQTPRCDGLWWLRRE